jgi:hypothetical protein
MKATLLLATQREERVRERKAMWSFWMWVGGGGGEGGCNFNNSKKHSLLYLFISPPCSNLLELRHPWSSGPDYD